MHGWPGTVLLAAACWTGGMITTLVLTGPIVDALHRRWRRG